MDTVCLSEAQLDALRELGNIGAGNAVTSLSAFTGRLVTLAVPEVQLAPLNTVAFLLGPPETMVAGVFLEVRGAIDGQILLVLPVDAACQFGRMLLGDIGAEESLALSAVAESGNILAGAYLGAIEQLTGLSAQPSVPAVAIDMAGALLSSIVAQQGEMAEEALVINACFMDAGEELKGHFLLLPTPDALQRLLAALCLA
ncbi:MAG TPA: chemotaxis protein CheC [Armatimonadota bacterium]|nr:chemotaxis protein CheC [Armatimonadota bacterium]